MLDAWANTKDQMRAGLGRDRFQALLEQAQLVDYQPNPPRCTILIPSAATATTLTNLYLEPLLAATTRMFGQPTELEIVSVWQPPLPERQVP